MDYQEKSKEILSSRLLLLQKELELAKETLKLEITRREKIEFELTERKKELNCQNQISKILTDTNLPQNQVISEILKTIPPAWQFPDIAQASISVGDKRFATPGFVPSEYSISQPIVVNKKRVGTVVVSYPPDKLPGDMPVFLPEEEHLLYSIAKRIQFFVGNWESETALQRSESLYQSFMNASPDGLVVTDLDGRIEYVSPSTLKKFGYKNETVFIGSSILKFIDQKDHSGVMAEIEKMFQNNFDGVDEFVGIKADKTLFTMEVNGEFIRDKEGQPEKMIYVIRDISDRKLTEEKLRLSEENFRKMVETIHDVVYEIGADGEIYYISPSIQKLVGYTPEEMTGHRFLEFAHSDDQPEMLLALQNIASLGNRYFEFRFPAKNGDIHWFRVSTTPLFTGGIVAGGYGSLTEITEMKKAELALKESEQRYKDAQSLAKLGHWEFDVVRNKLSWSEEFFSILEIDPTVHPADYEMYKELVHPEDRTYSRETYLNSLKTREPYDIVYRVKMKNGEIKYINERCIIEFDVNNSPVRAIGTVMDITGRVQMEKELREKEERFRQITEQSRTVIWEVDENGLYTYVSPISTKEWGYQPEELVGKLHYYDLHPAKGREEFIKNSRQVFAEKKNFENLPNEIVKKDGAIILVATNGVPILDENSNLKGYRGADNDVTEQKRAEQKLLESEERYRIIFENIQDTYYETIPDGTIVEMSPSVAVMTKGQYTREELIGTSILNLYANLQDREDFFREVTKSGRVFNYELNILNKDGSIIPVSVHSSLKLDEQGNLVKVLGSARDITESKKAREKLQQSEAALNHAQEIAKMGSWAIDFQMRKQRWSANMYRIIGMKPFEKEMTYEDFLQLVHPDDRRLFREAEPKLFETKKELDFEFRLKKKSGEYIWLMSNIVPVFEGDQLIVLEGTNIDITAKKKNEEKIRLQNERLAAIVEAMPDPLFVSDRQGNYLEYFKPEGYELLVSDKILIGKSVFDVFDEKNANLHIQKISECIDRKELVSYEYSAVKDNKHRFYEGRIVPLGEEQVLRFVRDITERKQYELEIKKLLQAVQQSPVMTVITDLDANIEYVNSSFEKVTGYHFKEVVEKNPGILKSGYTKKAKYQELWAALAKGKSWKGEWLNKKKSGELYWEDVNITPIRNAEGSVINYLAIMQDITQRKKYEAELQELTLNLENKVNDRTKELAEKNVCLQEEIRERQILNEALQLSELRLELAMEAARMAWWEMNIETGEIIFHKRKTEMLGYPYEKFRHYTDFMNLVHPDDYENTMNSMRNHYQGLSDRYETEYRIRKKSGEYTWFYDVGSISKRKPDGTPLEVVGFVTDINPRKMMEMALAEKTKELENFFNVTLDLLCIGDSSGNLIKVNKAWESTLGYSIQEIEGKKFVDLIHPDDLQSSLDAMESLDGQNPVLIFTNRFLTKDGNFRFIEWHGAPYKNLIYAAARDVTERKKAEEEIWNAKVEAEKANQAKSEFLSRMSHELRTPMNSILGFAQLLNMGVLDPRHKKGVDHIMRSGKHLLKLINEVLEISRIEAGRLSLSLEPVSLNNLIGELIDFVSNHAREKQVEIIFYVPSDEVFVKADKQKLKQVLLNLLNNAIKYNREKGFIEVGLAITEKNEQSIKQVMISVCDTGFGITEENISKLFNPFERVGADKTGIEGSGLGLAVSKKLTEAMGGKIGVESEFQKGSTFWVEFPFAEGKRKSELKPGTGEESAMNNEILGTVLYVEDNESNIELIGQALLDHRPGIVLFSDKDGSQAVRLALEKMPDLILLDLNLPEIQGDEILRQIIQNEKIRHIPVLIVSADAMPGQIKKMLQLGAREYITKPLDINMFLKAVDSYIKPGEKKSSMN